MVKDTFYWLIASILALIAPVQEYIFTCEALIVLNWVADSYVKRYHITKHKKRKSPVYVQLFAVTTVIIIARWVDDRFFDSYDISYKMSLALVLFELGVFYKNISIILGIDITRYIKK